MKVLELLTESTGEKFNLIDILEEFLPFVVDNLNISTLPKITFQSHISDDDQPTFGRYDNVENTLTLAILNRHPLDILRTMAHELAHHVQNLENRLGPHSGETGSAEENEANEKAGIIMRDFNKLHPEFFNSQAVF